MEIQFFLHYQDRKVELFKGKSYKIGRSPQSDICLEHPTVSRIHARLFWDVDGFTLEDQNSSNGIRIRNNQVSSIKLTGNERIYFGEFLLEYRLIIPESDSTDLPETNTRIINEKFDHIMESVGRSDIGDKIKELKGMFTKKKDELKDLANKDTLTGLFNRRYFDQKTDEEVARAIRYKRSLSFIMADIDHFKRFNDTYGHQKGDEVLAFVAGIMDSCSRNQDIVFRYGGEEMCILLPETPLKQAKIVAENLRMKIEYRSEKQLKLRITASMGVSELNQKVQSPEALLQAADQALYRAKDRGRNCVVLAK